MTPEHQVLRLSTDQFPAKDRIAKWREEFGRLLFRLDIEPLGQEQFRSDVQLRSLPGLKLMSGMCTPAEFDASAALVANNDDSIGIIRNVDPVLVRQLNRESTLGPGDAMVVSWTDPVTVTLPQGAKATTLVRLSRPVLQALVPGLSDTYGRMLPDIGGALQSLFDYLNVLEDQQAIATPDLQHIVVTHIYDLAALALGASRDMAEVAKERGLRAAPAGHQGGHLRPPDGAEPVPGRHRPAPPGVAALRAEALRDGGIQLLRPCAGGAAGARLPDAAGPAAAAHEHQHHRV